jgi:hypothetical protein
MRYRDGLTRTLVGAAIPYGYTLVVWSSGSVVGERHGPPDLWEIVLFFAGASAAYALLRLAVRGGDVHLEHWASRHHIVATSVVQGSLAVAVATAAAAAAHLAAFWSCFIAPFAATIAYLCGVAISEAHVIPNAEHRRDRPSVAHSRTNTSTKAPAMASRSRRRLAVGEPSQARTGRRRNRRDDNR